MRLRLGALVLPLFIASVAAVSCGESDDNSGSNSGDGDSSGGAGDSSGGDGDSSGDGDTSGDGDGASMPSGAGSIYCESDKACRDANGVCNLDLNTCVECVVNEDCDANSLCQQGVCRSLTPCQSSKDCGDDEVCAEQHGFCVNCEGANDCADGQNCVDFRCFDACDSDKDCTAGGNVCNLDLAICVECAADADCDDGFFCSEVDTCVERVCQDGDVSCEDGTLIACNDRGNGYAVTTCAGGCNADGDGCDEPECQTGDEGCECYPNDTCNNMDVLSCLSGFCVDASGN